MTTARRTFPHGGTVTVEAGGQRIVLTGRRAAMVSEVATDPEIDHVTFGTVHLDLTPCRVRTRVEHTRMPVDVE